MPVIAVHFYVYHCPECGFQSRADDYGTASQHGINHLKSHRKGKKGEECEDMSQSATDAQSTDSLIAEQLAEVEASKNTI